MPPTATKKSPPALSVNIIYDKNCIQGVKQDAAFIEYASRELNHVLKHRIGSVRTMDPREPPVQADVNIHIEVPALANLPWARVNILIVNPSVGDIELYKSVYDVFDYFIVRTEKLLEIFKETLGGGDKCIYVPWRSNWTRPKATSTPKKEFVTFLGHSAAKLEAAKAVIPYWKESYPPLTVYTSTTIPVPAWVSLKVGNYSDEERKLIGSSKRGHLVLASSDAAAHTLLEALELGATVVTNDIDAYRDVYSRPEYSDRVIVLQSTVGRADNNLAEKADLFSILPTELDRVINEFEVSCEKPFKFKNTLVECQQLVQLWKGVGTHIESREKPRSLPPILKAEDAPNISVITLLYNRRKFFDIARHSMLLTDYPKAQIEWIVIEDSDDVSQGASDMVANFIDSHGKAFRNIMYIPLDKKRTIGEKRNLAITAATSDIILFMDDDDHYPQTSFRRRVAWLTSSLPNGLKPECSACTSIAMYDLVRACSAVNVPPGDLPICKRVSEATLTFYKKFWEERNFPEVNMAEGEEWLKGRESKVVEISPQQIIVAFNHNMNISDRKIPEGTPRGCFWGFPKEYLEFIHGIAGIKVEWEK